MASRWKTVLSAVSALIVVGVAGVAWWVVGHAGTPDPEGTWRNGSFFLELKPDGTVGGSQLPVSVCGGTSGAVADPVVLVGGSWAKEYVTDAGDGVRIDAARNDGRGRCSFWVAYLSHDGEAELWFSYVPSPVKSLVKAL
ncbi:hypothetical protein OH807_32095 [Kitasatospora sp. NBC_01560]|uniref:hypothetical protein n=1 Tax=Kitasatospora sp. NBC_01560 TaxID=2975965 RepID=UPI0038668360